MTANDGAPTASATPSTSRAWCHPAGDGQNLSRTAAQTLTNPATLADGRRDAPVSTALPEPARSTPSSWAPGITPATGPPRSIPHPVLAARGNCFTCTRD
jgi:hypothetical protein